MEEKKVSFEQTVGDAKEILSKLSNPELPLHESVALYKEGSQKIAYAMELLEQAKLEIQEEEVEG